MGFIRRIFGAKKAGTTPPTKERKRWSFTRSSNAASYQSNKRDASLGPCDYNLDANKRAIAVAAATATVAEAALLAAHAAAEVVRLTSGGGERTCGSSAHVSVSYNRWAQEFLVAVKIQSAFRGYLARRALRALKALVKLQALVRGHIVRKQTADMLRRMQTLVRLQARARACRTHTSESFHLISKSYHSQHNAPAGPEKNRFQLRTYSTKFDGPSILKRCGSNANMREVINLDKAQVGSNWLDRWMEEDLWNNNRDTSFRQGYVEDDKSDKILEVDTWKPHLNSQQSSRTFQTSQLGLASDNNSHSFMTFDSPRKSSPRALNPMPSVSSGEVLSLSSLKFALGKNEATLRTADNSPQVNSASSRPGSSARRGPFTPTRSECSRGFFNGYSGYPNYMANTESSRAKVRSQSAPRQRLEFEKYGSTKSSVQGYWDAGTDSERSFGQHLDIMNRAYPASDYGLNKHGSVNPR